MTNFTNVFGGTVVRPSDVSYLAVALTADITLEWPLESNSPDYPAAGAIDVTSTVGAYTITLPDATQTGAGATLLFNALGGNTQSFTVKDNAGGAIATIDAGKQWIFLLAGTATAAGTWRVFQLGASTATVQASALAGYGLTTLANQLSQATQVTTFSSSPRTALMTDRAGLLVWTGAGSGTINLPASTDVGNNWFLLARNAGGGDLTIDPNGSETINGSATLAMHPGDSAVIATDGTAWYTVGLGRDATFAFDFTSISLTGAGATYTLAGAELNRVCYKLTGTLSNNVAVVVPPTIQQYWVDNATTGSFTVTLKTASGTPIAVTQGARGIYYCNGTNVVAADTASIAVPISPSEGGTGQVTYTIGDILYASGTSTLSRLADVATGNALTSGGVGVAPSWGKIGLTTHVTGALPPANGGLGTTGAPTNGQVAIGNGTNFTLATLTQGAGVTITNGVGTITIAASGGSMVYPGSGIANSTGSAWGTSYGTSGTGSTIALTAGPTFTGAPAAPTATAGTNTTQIATTAFVTTAVAGGGSMVYPGAGIAVSTGSAWTTSLSSTAPTFTTSVTSPLVNGGTSASATLVIQSTSGAGTTDKIQFKTGSQVVAGQVDTSGSWTIGGNSNAGGSLFVNTNLTSTTAYGTRYTGTLQSSGTGTVYSFQSAPTHQSATFTCAAFHHYSTAFSANGVGLTITDHYGFSAQNGLTNVTATNLYGFWSGIAAGTGRWAFYGSGTAASYFGGGVIISPGYTVAGLPTGAVGMRAYVTDASSPTWLATPTGGGSTRCPVFYNGSAWVAG